MDVAGGDAGDVEALGEQRQPAVAGAVAAPVGPLQLDPEALAAEAGEQAPREPLPRCGAAAFEGSGNGAVPSAPREADQPLRVFLHLLERRPRLCLRPLR